MSEKEHDLDNKLKELIKEIENKETYLNRLKSDIVSRESMLKVNEENLPKEYKRYEDEIKLRDKQIETLKEGLQKKSSDWNEETKKLNEETKKLNEEIKKLNEEMKKLNEESKKLNEELKNSKSYAEELKKSQVQKDLLTIDLKTQIENKIKEIDNLNNLVQILTSKEEQLNIEAKNEIERIKGISLDLESKIAKLNQDNIYLTKENEKITNELNLTKIQLNSANQTIQSNAANANNQNNQNNNNNSMIIDNISLEKLSKEHEEEKLHSNQLRKERSELETKMTSMKSALQEIKDKFEIELAKKEKLLNETNGSIPELMKKIKAYEESIRILKKTINNNNKDKLELEEIILKQEEKVSELGNKFGHIDKMLKDKNKELSDNEKYIMQLVGIVEEQKKTISSFNNSNMGGSEENDKEINYMRNHINNLRKDLEMKEDKISALQSKNVTLSNEVKRLKNFMGSENNQNNNHNANNNVNKKASSVNKRISYTDTALNKDKERNIDIQSHRDYLPPIKNKTPSSIKNLEEKKTPSPLHHQDNNYNSNLYENNQKSDLNFLEENDNNDNFDEITNMMNKIIEEN